MDQMVFFDLKGALSKKNQREQKSFGLKSSVVSLLNDEVVDK